MQQLGWIIPLVRIFDPSSRFGVSSQQTNFQNTSALSSPALDSVQIENKQLKPNEKKEDRLIAKDPQVYQPPPTFADLFLLVCLVTLCFLILLLTQWVPNESVQYWTLWVWATVRQVLFRRSSEESEAPWCRCMVNSDTMWPFCVTESFKMVIEW